VRVAIDVFCAHIGSFWNEDSTIRFLHSVVGAVGIKGNGLRSFILTKDIAVELVREIELIIALARETDYVRYT